MDGTGILGAPETGGASLVLTVPGTALIIHGASTGLRSLADLFKQHGIIFHIEGNHENQNQGESQLSNEAQKSILSLEKQIAEHEEKLKEYEKNPDAFDNMGFLKNAPSEEIRNQIIERRVKHLKHEIETFKNNIEKLKRGKK